MNLPYGSTILKYVAPLLIASQALAGGTIRYAEDRAPGIIQPFFATTMSEARIHELIFDGLYTDDLELRSAPRLASSAVLADDRRSMDLNLRDDVRWHDGQPFTAADVVFTIQAMKDRETASTESGRVAWIKEATAVGTHRVHLEFEEETWNPQDLLHFKILPAHAFSGLPVLRSHAFRHRPVGTGPFMFVSLNDDNSITLQQNETSPFKPRLDGMVLREVTDKNYQAKLLMYESLDALVRVLPRDLAPLQADRNVELYPYQTNSWWYVGFNHDDDRLADPRVRRAISLLVDVPALLAPVGTGDVLSGPFVASSPFYNHEVKPRPTDPDQAADLLAEAGYAFNGRHWIGEDGKQLKVRLATMQNLETAQDVVIQLQSQLQTAGIGVEPEFLPVVEWRQRVWRDRAFDLVLSLWSFDRNEDIYEQFHSKGTRNFVGYRSEPVDALLDEARASADPHQKKQLLRQVHATLAEDDPMIFLWTLDSYSALSVKVKNVVVHPFYFFTWAQDWTTD